MGVLLASSGFLLAWVVSDIKHSLFTQVLIRHGLFHLSLRGKEEDCRFLPEIPR